MRYNSVDKPIVWAAYNSNELLSWSKKEGRKVYEEAKTQAEEHKEDFMKQAQEMFAEAMKESNWEDYLMDLAEKNPDIAAKLSQYHDSNFADMINDPEKYINELKEKHPEMAQKFQDFNEMRKAKMEELYEARPELREMLNEAKYQFEEETHFEERREEFNGLMHRFSEKGKAIQEKNLKLQEHSKNFNDKFGNKLDASKSGDQWTNEIGASNVTDESQNDNEMYSINR